MQICRVGRHVIGVAPSRVPDLASHGGRHRQRPRRSRYGSGEPDASNRLLVAGCDPALSLLAIGMRAKQAWTLCWPMATARGRLEWLKAGRSISRAAISNEPAASARAFNSVTFALWEEGFVVQRGNPRGIHKIEDLANPKVRFVNREEGSGSRRLFDSLLHSAGMSASKVRTLNSAFCAGHLAAARQWLQATPTAASPPVLPPAASDSILYRWRAKDSNWCCISGT